MEEANRHSIQMKVDTMEIRTEDKVLFWHNDSPLSNWYPGLSITAPFGEGGKGIVFHNSEAIFMFLKAVLFKDVETAQLIVDNQSPPSVKGLGRQIKNFDQAVWDREKEECMYIACMLKFTRDQDMMEYLLGTNDLMIVEASPVDKIWGIGLAPDDPKAGDEKNWTGQNLLGKVLMRVRAEIVSELVKQAEDMMKENQKGEVANVV
jgi:hypothetical protein